MSISPILDRLTLDAVLRIGEVSAVEGRRIFVKVDTNKNLSDMFLDGELVRNISVNSYVEIRKGFLSIIGKVDGERVESSRIDESARTDRDAALGSPSRILSVTLAGYLGSDGLFRGGTRELPLVGNEAYILTPRKLHRVHNLVREGVPAISIATSADDDFEVQLPIDGLFNGHIAIFGNTGSGKSNTLAALYQALIAALRSRNLAAFRASTRFLFFDFNGEYGRPECLTHEKKVVNLSTRVAGGDTISFDAQAILNIEVISILAEATEKTQRPFLRRALRLYGKIREAADPTAYLKGILRGLSVSTLTMTDKTRAQLLIDYFRSVLPDRTEGGEPIDIDGDIEWHGRQSEFTLRGRTGAFLYSSPDLVTETNLFQAVEHAKLDADPIGQLVQVAYVQLIDDVVVNRAQNEHIAPVVNRLRAKRADIERLFTFEDGVGLWAESNVVVINLNDVNIDMKKVVPLLVARQAYVDHKEGGGPGTLTMVIDEAHNILSAQSTREAETWKDYRLETFEEIIKEGRKFGVFVTIASQRPGDISETISSQAHNYFIHRLINQFDLKAIGSAVSYIDRVTEDSIPTLPTGVCVFSGVAGQVPLKLAVRPLPMAQRPHSATRIFCDVVPQPAAPP